MTSIDEQLRAKLRKVEALYFGAGTAGERDAAGAAVERLRAKLAEVGRQEPPTELQFSMPDPWAVRLFVALCRRYGFRPYRYPRQRRTTIMVLAPRRFFDAVVMRQFADMHAQGLDGPRVAPKSWPDHDRKAAFRSGDLHGVRPATEDADRVREHQLLRDLRQSVVVPPDDEAADAGLMQTVELPGEEPDGRRRGLLPVVEVAEQREGIDALPSGASSSAAELAVAGSLRRLGWEAEADPARLLLMRRGAASTGRCPASRVRRPGRAALFGRGRIATSLDGLRCSGRARRRR